MDNSKVQYDLILIGGGASASFLALQILKKDPAFRIAILEKETTFPPKLGESIVDQTALFLKSLGLDHLLEKHAIKTGVRFLFNESNSNDIQDVAEFASPTLPGYIKAYHLNRPVFDEDLLQTCIERGAIVYRPAKILHSQFDNFYNELEIEVEGSRSTIISKWCVDATGRARYFHNELGWKDLNINLNTGALTAHFHGVSDPSEWDTARNHYWENQSIGSRAFSTTHLMRNNAWWWIIKLDEKTTSIGMVFDKNKRSFEDPTAYFEKQFETDAQLKALTKNATHGPVRHVEQIAYVSEKLFAQGQAVIGDSGAFIDPLISPGLELIGQQSIWLTELLIADLRSNEYKEAAWKKYEKKFLEAYQSRLLIYENAYGLMDSFDLFSAWLRQGNFVYFGFIVYPTVLFKSRLKYPLRFNFLERTALLYFARRFAKIHQRRAAQHRISSTSKNTIAYSGVRGPKSPRLLLMPFSLFFRAIFAYFRVEWIEFRSFFTKKR